MNTTVITFLNEKGGVGKTTCALHVAAGLAIRGKRVLMIDADPQANLTDHVQIPHGKGLMELLVYEAEWRELIKRVDPLVWCAPHYRDDGELMILPGHIMSRAIPLVVDEVWQLRERIEELRGVVDVVVIDTPPTPSMLHVAVYLATDAIVYPTEFEMMALTGLKRSIDHMENLNKQRVMAGLQPVDMLGVQPTMYDVRTNAHDFGASITVKEFKNKLWPALALRTKWRDASFARQTLFAYAPGCEAEVEAWAMVKRVERGMPHPSPMQREHVTGEGNPSLEVVA